MKILIAGAAWHDDLVNVTSFGFQELGHTAVIFDDAIKTMALTQSKIANRLPFLHLKSIFNERYRRQVGKRLHEAVAKEHPDMVFVINGIKYLHEDIQRIRRDFAIPAVAYVIDDPLLSERWLYDLGAYSHLFVIDRSWMGYLEFFNAGRVFYLPQTGNHRAFKPLGLERPYDIGFGGSLSLRLPNAPSGFVRAQILNALAQAGFSIQAFASGIAETFRYFPALKTIDYYDGYKNHEELNKLYNRAKIVVSVHSPQFKTGISPRVFEAAFAGSFQLIQYEDDVDVLFPGCGVSFKSLDELIEKARYYIAHGDERETIAKMARDIALLEHTFKSRAEQVMHHVYG